MASINVKAGSCSLNATGDWETPGSWNCGHAPGTGDDVTIGPGMTVTVNNNNLANIGNVDVFGTLEFTNGSKINLASTSLINIYSGGSITGGNGGAKIVFPSASYSGPFSTTGPFFFTNSGSGSGLLPLTLLSFYSSQQNHQLVLNWKTENEENIKSFEIESLRNGNTSWEQVGMVTPMAVSGGGYSYSFIDQSKTIGDRYYRLKIVGTDGKYIYSKVLSITAGQTGTVSISPTMVYGSINITLPSEGQVAISIFNTYGQLVKTVATASDVLNIDVSGLSRGEYFINALQRNNSYTTKFLKQ